MDYRKIKLQNGKDVFVDFSSRRAACRMCGQLIRFGTSDGSRLFPIIEKNGLWQEHYNDCKEYMAMSQSGISGKIADEELNQKLLSEL